MASVPSAAKCSSPKIRPLTSTAPSTGPSTPKYTARQRRPGSTTIWNSHLAFAKAPTWQQAATPSGFNKVVSSQDNANAVDASKGKLSEVRSRANSLSKLDGVPNQDFPDSPQQCLQRDRSNGHPVDTIAARIEAIDSEIARLTTPVPSGTPSVPAPTRMSRCCTPIGGTPRTARFRSPDSVVKVVASRAESPCRPPSAVVSSVSQRSMLVSKDGPVIRAMPANANLQPRARVSCFVSPRTSSASTTALDTARGFSSVGNSFAFQASPSVGMSRSSSGGLHSRPSSPRPAVATPHGDHGSSRLVWHPPILAGEVGAAMATASAKVLPTWNSAEVRMRSPSPSESPLMFATRRPGLSPVRYSSPRANAPAFNSFDAPAFAARAQMISTQAHRADIGVQSFAQAAPAPSFQASPWREGRKQLPEPSARRLQGQRSGRSMSPPTPLPGNLVKEELSDRCVKLQSKLGYMDVSVTGVVDL